MFCSARIIVISLITAALLQACGGGDSVGQANISSAESLDPPNSANASALSMEDAVFTTSADGSFGAAGERVQALAVKQSAACKVATGGTCRAASPVLETSKSVWALDLSGNGTQGMIDQAQGLVSARSLAINYNFKCLSTAVADCGRVRAMYAPTSGIPIGNALTLSYRAQPNAVVRVSICDTNGQCFEYDARRSAGAVADAWTQVVIDLTSPIGARSTLRSGTTARSLAIIAIAPLAGSTSGWIEVDGLQFVNVTVPAAASSVASGATNAAATAAVAIGDTTTATSAVTTSTPLATPAAITSATTAASAKPAVSTTTTDEAVGIASGGFAPTADTQVAAVAPLAPVATANSPVVFNASDTVRPGDLVSVQGFNFGTSPQAWLEGPGGTLGQSLKIVNKVGTSWLAAEVPATANGALILRVGNGSLVSAPVKLNAAVAHNLDALQVVPGGAFRVFGRNLLVAGATPVVRVDGALASVDVASSDENMLVARAPGALQSTVNATISIDNGNGTGPSLLDRRVAVVTGQSGDPFGLSVGWAAGFSAFSSRVINAANDSRLGTKVACNGQQDDASAIQGALDFAASNAGGVVQLPAGTCRIGRGIALRSNVVLQGAGKAMTTLRYEGNFPLVAVNIDLAGVRNLAVVNAGAVEEGVLLKQSTRLFMQNVLLDAGTTRQMFFTDNTNMIVTGSDFIQRGSINENGPYLFNGSGGLVFTMNTTSWVMGANSFGRVHDAYIAGNTFTRDARAQNNAGVIHSFTIDFAYRIAAVGNTFNVANGPITNTARNDGETMLTEAGGANRTENLGTLSSASADSFTDSNNVLNIDPFGTGVIPENYGIAIVSGSGAGQHRRLTAYANGKVTVDRAWDVIPPSGSHYATFVWGLEKSYLKGNLLSQNPRGIWLYQSSLRDVAVIGNTITEGGGIYLRSNQNLASKMFTPMYNVRIAKNTVKNTTRNWMSYVNAMFVNVDAKEFGTAMTGIDIKDNVVQANVPNVTSQLEEYANVEGYITMTRFENFNTFESGVSPRLLGTLFQRNLCVNCDVGFRIGTGATGVVLWSNQLMNSAALVADSNTGNSKETSIGTVIK